MKRPGSTARYVTFSAMFTALIAVATAYMLHVHLPLFGSHTCVHLGDSVVYLCASLLPVGYACAAAAFGGALADFLCGSAFWAPWTFVIKAFVVLCFSPKGNIILTKRNYCGIFLACPVTMFGYYIAEAILYGNWLTPIYAISGNAIQAIGGGILYIVISLILDKVNIKKQIHL